MPTEQIAETPFAEAGVSATKAGEIMDILSVSPMEMKDNKKFSTFREVLKFVGQFADGDSLIRSVAFRTPPQDRLQKVSEYVQIRKQLKTAMDKIEEIQSAIGEDEVTPEMMDSFKEVLGKRDRLLEEAKIYES